MATREVSHIEAGRGPTLQAAQSVALVVGIGICLTLSLAFAVGALQRSKGPPAIRSGERINPNEAPVARLMRLPQVGVTRARAIVAHRGLAGAQAGRQPAFQTADDLQQIKGIGPAIVEDVRPWLQFDDASDEANKPAQR